MLISEQTRVIRFFGCELDNNSGQPANNYRHSSCVSVQFIFSQNTDDSLFLGFIYAAYRPSTDVLAVVYASTVVSFSALADTLIHGFFGKRPSRASCDDGASVPGQIATFRNLRPMCGARRRCARQPRSPLCGTGRDAGGQATRLTLGPVTESVLTQRHRALIH